MNEAGTNGRAQHDHNNRNCEHSYRTSLHINVCKSFLYLSLLELSRDVFRLSDSRHKWCSSHQWIFINGPSDTHFVFYFLKTLQKQKANKGNGNRGRSINERERDGKTVMCCCCCRWGNFFYYLLLVGIRRNLGLFSNFECSSPSSCKCHKTAIKKFYRLIGSSRVGTVPRCNSRKYFWWAFACCVS